MTPIQRPLPARSGTRRGAVVALAALALAACGDSSDDDGGATGTAAPSDAGTAEVTAPAAPASSAASIDGATTSAAGASATPAPSDLASQTPYSACDAFEPEQLAELVTFEFGDSVWEERPDPTVDDRCEWFNESKLLSLTLGAFPEFTYDLATERDIEGLEARDLGFADGAFASFDPFGETTYRVWAPLPDGSVMLLQQSVLQIDEATMATLAELAHTALQG